MEESDLETEVKTPPKKKKSQREKREAKKKKQKAEKKMDQPAATRTSTTMKWKEGDTFKSGMEWHGVPGNHKRAFIQAHRKLTRSGTSEVKTYNVDSLKKMLKKAEDE